MGVQQVLAMAAVNERVGTTAVKHIGHGIDRHVVDAARVLIAHAHGIPHCRAADDDERQPRMHLLHQRHHGSRRARRGHGEQTAQLADDAVERRHRHC